MPGNSTLQPTTQVITVKNRLNFSHHPYSSSQWSQTQKEEHISTLSRFINEISIHFTNILREDTLLFAEDVSTTLKQDNW